VAIRSSLIPIADLTERDLSRWRELSDRALEPNPFFEPDFVMAGAEHLDQGVGLLVVARSSEEWLACLPVSSITRWKRLPVAAVAAWRNLYGYLGTPLVAPGDPEGALSALVSHALEGGPRQRILVLDWVRPDGPVGLAIANVVADRPGRPLRYEEFDRALLERRPGGDYLEETLRPHHRRELRRQGRRLGEALGAPIEARDVTGDRAMVELFMELEDAGWKGRRGTAFAQQPEHAAFFRQVCDSFRSSGRLQMLALTAGDKIAALKCNLLAGDELFGFKIAMDESLSRFSPGVQLEVAAVTEFHERMPHARFDSCAAPDNEMINRLWPDRRPLVSYAIPTASATGWASARGVEAAFQVHNKLRRAT
jgi:CelD/BcsL family acetyltransferase involved in cellulose biosynthesis